MLTIDGLVTGIDTTGLVEGLLEIQQRQIDLLRDRQAEIAAEQTAFGGVEARLLSLRSAVTRLTRAGGSLFRQKAVSVSDEAALSAAAAGKAAPGTYQLRVDALAASHQIATQGLAAPESEITQGDLLLQVGDSPATTITIDATNNTLQGLADAINAADADVAATVINDGSGGGAAFRLLLTSQRTGTAGAISVTNNLAASSGSATQPTFDLANPVQAAADAQVTLGSGAGAITVQSGTNQVQDLIDGVTLNLLAADPAKTLSVTVAADTEAARTAVEDFVAAFNDFTEFVDEQVRFDSASGQAGVLLGNRSVVDLQDEVRRAVLDVVPGIDGPLNRLTALGVRVGSTGELTIDSARLDDVLSGRVEGVSTDDVARLFALTGRSDNPNVQFVLGSSRTKAGETPYQVDVTQAAERAAVLATNTLAASTVIDSSNNTLTLTIDGAASSTLTLADGTYTREELADHLEAIVNADDALTGRSVIAAVQGDRLQITSETYGGSSQVAVGTGTALAALGFDGTETDTGVDVAGTFLVDGVSEAAAGSGRILTGDVDNEHTADLRVRVTLAPTQVAAGVDAEITVTRGLAALLDQRLESLLDPVSGRLQVINDGFDDRLDDIQESIDAQNERFEAQRQALVEQFVALERAVQELQTTGSFITAQLAGLANLQAGGSS